ncbi:MAG: ABC transporter substrate-binding protein [Pseudohongiellaceae bacterium]
MKLLKNLIFVSTLFVAVTAVAQQPAMSALETAEKGVQTLLQTVQDSKSFIVSDRDRYFAAIEIVLNSFVDFEEVAVVVMSGLGDTATPEQKQQFAEILRNTLTRFYGATLASYNGEELVFLPPANPPADPSADQVVGMELRGSDSSIRVQYQMFLNEAGEWKLKNLSLGGINLGRQYYTQFSAAMAQYNNDIDQVLANWK